MLLAQKNEWTEQLDHIQNENQKTLLEGTIFTINYCMTKIEKRFDLF